jgi:hypothetical protein
MPRLGQPAEPAHEPRVEPWWRAVDTVPMRAAPEATTLPNTVPWPLD